MAVSENTPFLPLAHLSRGGAGPNAIAVESFRAAYTELLTAWFDDGDNARLEAGFLALARQIRDTLAAAGPPTSVGDALALARFQCELLEEADGLKDGTSCGAMVSALAEHLSQFY